ncbi:MULTISPECIES: LamG-like jellyroll fold domain-containing protein [unclassified Curtobacterium]|uniref:LamG-like jellyroll fold domain-containing protein n=1 Tax=unclassified Curtobacterium TaxID=257496 RepID=UPI00226B2A6C|nr:MULTISPECIES: LamG-like jellyroll fold domain-containing protein [unclassified Curtobacterium]
MSTTITTWHRRCVGDVPRLLLAVAARTVLWSVLLLALWSNLPAILGWHVTTVVSGSMAPAIRTGDVVAAMPTGPDAVTPGRVLLVEDPDHDDRLRLHRLRRVEPDGSLRLRGDANPAVDRTAVAPDAVLGIGVLRFPGVGLPRVWIADGAWSNLIAVGLTAAGLLLLARLDRPILAGEPCRRCGTPRWDLRTTPMRPRGTGTATAPAAVPLVAGTLVVLIGLSTAFSGATFSGTTTTRAALGSSEFGCFHHDPADAVLAWDFAEKDGTRVADVSGHGADGFFANAGAVRVDGDCAANPSVQLTADGAEGYAVTTTPVAAPNVFTISAWFRTDVAGGRVFGFGSDQSLSSAYRDRHLFIDTGGRLRFGTEESGSQFKFAVTSAGRVDDGQWHHAVGTFTSGSMVLWLDGERQGSRSDARSLRQYGGYWRVGRQSLDGWSGSGAFAFTGDVDTVRVHDRVLDPATVAAEYAAGR